VTTCSRPAPALAIIRRALVLAIGATALGCASARTRAPSPTPPSQPPAARAPAPASTPAPAPAGGRTDVVTGTVREQLNVVYGTGGGQELKLDLYAPANPSGPLPAVVLIHGGGWCSGCKDDFRAIARGMAEKGYFAVTAGYRLAPQHRFPAQLEDVKCAVRWVRANAPYYGVDPERIGAAGASAGGHLALLLGMTYPSDGFEGQGGYAGYSSKVAAVVNIMGPTDLSRSGWSAATEKMIFDLVGGSRDRTPAGYWAASPVAYVRPGGPPVLTIHGTADAVVPYEQAQLLHSALRGAGVDSRLEAMQDKGHGFDWGGDGLQRCAALLVQFCDEHLKRR
jgi:acetyl esterase/lipase